MLGVLFGRAVRASVIITQVASAGHFEVLTGDLALADIALKVHVLSLNLLIMH